MKIYILLFISIVSLTLSCSDERTAQEIISDISDNTKNGDFKSLNSDYIKLIGEFPTNSNSYYVIAKSQSKTGMNEEAILNFKKALDLDSLNHLIYIERAILKIKLGDNNGAISDCLDAIRINGKYSYAFSTMALAYENLNEIGNSIHYYEKAKLYDIQNGNIHYKLGMLYLSYGETNKGCKNLSKAGELGIMVAFDIINSNCNFIKDNDSIDTKSQIHSELSHSNVTKYNNLNSENNIDFNYKSFSNSKLNPVDFSWKVIKEYKQSGSFRLNSITSTLILTDNENTQYHYKINKIQNAENGFIAFTESKHIIIFAIGYNRISIGKENSDLFNVFIIKDKDILEIRRILNKF